MHWGRDPRDRHIPPCTGADTPPGRRLLLRTVRILLECILLDSYFIYYLPQTKLREGNVFRGVCLFGGLLPSNRNPCGTVPPYPAPPTPSPLSTTSEPQKGTVCIALECFLVTGRNEVLAKVIFLHVCVILFTGGGALDFALIFRGGGAPDFALILGGSFLGGAPDFALIFRGGGLFIGGCSRFCSNFFGGVPPNFRGGYSRFCSNFSGGSFYWGGAPDFALIFWGEGSSKFSGGGSSKFSGGFLQIFLGGGFLQIFGGGVLHRNTVNVRPVRILLKCILVLGVILTLRRKVTHIKELFRFNSDWMDL